MATATNTMGQTSGGELILIDKTGKREEITIDEADDVSPFRRQIEVLAECLLNGEPFPYLPARDLATMQIIESAIESEKPANEELKVKAKSVLNEKLF